MVNLVHRHLEDGTLHVVVEGRIDSSFDGVGILKNLKGSRVVMDLSRVQSVSSLGVFAFTRLIDSIKHCEIHFVDVSPVVARQLAILPSLFAAVRVDSARLPFSCPRCGAELEHSVPFEKGAEVAHAPACPCGTPMELDGIPEQYLPS